MKGSGNVSITMHCDNLKFPNGFSNYLSLSISIKIIEFTIIFLIKIRSMRNIMVTRDKI